MGALARYFEEGGIATTQISLVRPHTEKIRPPRALWVPFELGRPFGKPNDREFQLRVMRAVLGLFEAPRGPLLADYGEDAAPEPESETAWACPVRFDAAAADETLEAAVSREIAELAPWYELSVQRHGRTIFGVSGLAIEHIPPFLASLLGDAMPASPNVEIPLTQALMRACEDLKAYYMTAVMAQPGNKSGSDVPNWFWSATAAATLLVALRPVCLASDDPGLQLFGKNTIVPRAQWDRFGITDFWWRDANSPSAPPATGSVTQPV